MNAQVQGPTSIYDVDGALAIAGANIPGAVAGQVLTANSAGGLALAPGLGLLAATGPSGFALQNATPTILSWTAPNDGNLHRVTAFGAMNVSSPETGGAVNLNFTLPDNSGPIAWGLFTGGQGAGFNYTQGFRGVLVKAGMAVTITQATALTAGAAVLWAEIWGS